MSSVHTWEYSHYVTTVTLKVIKRTAHKLQSVVLQYSTPERTEPDSRPAEIMDQCSKIPVVIHVKSEATTHVLEQITIFVIPLTSTECEKRPAHYGLFIVRLSLVSSEEVNLNVHKIKPRYSATLTYRTLKSVNKNSLLFSIPTYYNPRHTATHCGEQRVELYRSLSEL
jgi:hypothetical protein